MNKISDKLSLIRMIFLKIDVTLIMTLRQFVDSVSTPLHVYLINHLGEIVRNILYLVIVHF